MSGVAASYLSQRQAAADPIGAFSAGVQLRSNLQKIDLAAQAGQMDTLLNIVKIQNEQADSRIKEQLSKEQMQIAWYNAESNRINAMKPRAGTTGYGTGASPFSGLRFGPNGAMYFDTGSAGQPQQPGAPEAYQGPVEGQGDGMEVTPLRPGPETPRVLDPGAGLGGIEEPEAQAQPQVQDQMPDGMAAGGLTPQLGGQVMYTPPGMAGPSMRRGDPDAPTATGPSGSQIMPSVSGGAQQAQQGPPGMLKVSRLTINSKGQPSLSIESPDPKDAPGPQLTNAMLESINKSVAHLGKRAVPTKGSTKEGITEFDFEDIPTLAGKDFSASSLPEKQQAQFIQDALDLGALVAGANGNISDIDKMRAAGMVFPGDKDGREPTEDEIKEAAGQMVIQKKDWNAAYTAAQQQKKNAILEKATQYAIKRNAAFAGKPGYVPEGPEAVLKGLGFEGFGRPDTSNPNVAFGLEGNSGAVAAGSTGVSSGLAAGRDGKAVAVKTTAAAPAAQPAAPAAAPKAAEGPERDAAGFIVKKREEPKVTPYEEKRRKANVSWEESKQRLMKHLQGTVDLDEFKLLRDGTKTGGDPGMGIPSGGKSVEELRAKWLKENESQLAGHTLDSVLFTDHEGRAIKLREVFNELFKDERFSHPEKQIRPSEGKSQQGNQYSVTVGKTKEVK